MQNVIANSDNVVFHVQNMDCFLPQKDNSGKFIRYKFIDDKTHKKYAIDSDFERFVLWLYDDDAHIAYIDDYFFEHYMVPEYGVVVINNMLYIFDINKAINTGHAYTYHKIREELICDMKKIIGNTPSERDIKHQYLKLCKQLDTYGGDDLQELIISASY